MYEKYTYYNESSDSCQVCEDGLYYKDGVCVENCDEEDFIDSNLHCVSECPSDKKFYIVEDGYKNCAYACSLYTSL